MGYPALVDEGETVGLRAFATPARGAHEPRTRGAARLIRLVDGARSQTLRRDLAVNVQGEMVYRALAAHPLLNPELDAGRDLREDLLDRMVMTVFLEGQRAAAQRGRIRGARRERRGGIGLPAQEISRGVQAALERLVRIQSALAKADPAVAPPTFAAQLAWLVPAGFLLVTPVGAAAGISALPAGDRAAAREARPRSAARCATGGRDRAARSALPRTGQGRARLASLPARTNTAGCSRSSACRCSRSSSRRACRSRRGGSSDAWAERERTPQ